MKIVNAKKIMGAVVAALLVGSFVGCAAENVNPVVDAANNTVTEVKGYAKATASGIDFAEAAKKGYTIVEKASGIWFTPTANDGVNNDGTVYPFVEAGKVYEFGAYTTYNDKTKTEKVSFKILATGGVGALTMNADAFKVEAKADDAAYKVTGYKDPAKVDYFAYPVKAFSENVDTATVTYGVIGDVVTYDAFGNIAATTVALAKATDKKSYEATIAKAPVILDSDPAAAASNVGLVATGTTNDTAWYKLEGHDWSIVQTITVTAKGYSNVTFNVKKNIIAGNKHGTKAEVILAYVPTFPGYAFATSKAKTAPAIDTRDTVEKNVAKNYRVKDGKAVVKATFTGWADSIATWSTTIADNYYINAVKVNYGEVVEEPVVKPTLTVSYYKDELNSFKTTAGNTVKYTADTEEKMTFTGITMENDKIPTVTTTKYAGKIYHVATRAVNFADQNEYASNY